MHETSVLLYVKPQKQTDIAPWNTLESGPPENWTVMQLKRVRRKHETDGREGVFTVADAPGWVNILPITTDGNVVLVEQFRSAIAAATATR